MRSSPATGRTLPDQLPGSVQFGVEPRARPGGRHSPILESLELQVTAGHKASAAGHGENLDKVCDQKPKSKVRVQPLRRPEKTADETQAHSPALKLPNRPNSKRQREHLLTQITPAFFRLAGRGDSLPDERAFPDERRNCRKVLLPCGMQEQRKPDEIGLLATLGQHHPDP